MPFTKPFLNSLTDEHDKKVAQLFNEIPTSPGYLLENKSGMTELFKLLAEIKELSKNAINIKDDRGNDIAVKLRSMNPSPLNPLLTQYSMSELAKISSMLKTQHPGNMALAKAIDEYQETYYVAYNAINKPAGIYQILVGAQLLMDRNIPHQYEKSEPGQLFLLRNIVKPVIDIYEELETRNLLAADVSRIKVIIRDMEAELERLESDTNIRISQIQGDDFVSKFKKEKLLSEIDEFKRFSVGVKKELNHICDKIVAVETHAMTKQLQGHVKDKQLKKVQREIIGALNRDASKAKNLDYIMRSQFREYGEESAEKHHGSQVLPLNQSKLPEMGSSDGLCFGYSSLFLDVCAAPNWNDLSQEEKINKFQEHLAPNSSPFERDRSNKLKMNLAAGLKFDIQFIRSCPEAISNNVKAPNGKKFNLAKKLPASLIEKDPPQDILIAIYSKTAGHALSYRADVNGTIWFHDSNSGLYSFPNKKDFSNFLEKYISSNYSEFDQEFTLYDYKQLRQIADNNLPIPVIPTSKHNKKNKHTTDMSSLNFESEEKMCEMLGAVTLADLSEQLDKYLSAGNAKSENDDMIITLLKEGFAKISNTKAEDAPWLAFALISTIKREYHQQVEKNTTPAFVKMCNAYLDKIAKLIEPAELKKFAKNEQFISNKVKELDISTLQRAEPSVSPLRESNDSLRRRSTPLLVRPEQRQAENETPANKRPTLARAQATRLIENNPPLEVSPVNDMINLIQGEVAKLEKDSIVSNSTNEIITPLIQRLEELDKTDKSSVEKIAFARDLLKEFEIKAMRTAVGVKAFEIIHAILEMQPAKRNSPKN